MSFNILLVIHVILAVGIIGLVLIQHGKGADVGAAMGTGASASLFGSKGHGSFLTRLTTLVAILFAISSISLTLFVRAGNRDNSLTNLLEQVDDSVITIPSNDNAINNDGKK